jgi:hypothetical protein
LIGRIAKLDSTDKIILDKRVFSKYDVMTVCEAIGDPSSLTTI